MAIVGAHRYLGSLMVQTLVCQCRPAEQAGRSGASLHLVDFFSTPAAALATATSQPLAPVADRVQTCKICITLKSSLLVGQAQIAQNTAAARACLAAARLCPMPHICSLHRPRSTQTLGGSPHLAGDAFGGLALGSRGGVAAHAGSSSVLLSSQPHCSFDDLLLRHGRDAAAHPSQAAAARPCTTR